jgi:gamma-L-glutamyl-butirosin B gamma-L-glutamyl cyclotransferase
MVRGFGAIVTTKSCKCEKRDKKNWFRDGSLVCCVKCGNQWRTGAKYKEDLPFRTEFFERLRREREGKALSEEKAFFVYGSLLRGMHNHSLLDGYNIEVEEGSIEDFKLYDTGYGYPAIVGGKGTIKGEIIHINSDQYEDALKRMDRLEGYEEGSEHCLYNRETVAVKTLDR